MSDCIFCKIINQEIPCSVVYQDEKVLVINDISPVAPVHLLILPKKHIISVVDLEDENEGIVGYMLSIAAKLSKQMGFADKGFRVVANIGEDGGQAVPHLHFHILAGRSLQWPPG